MVNPNFEMVKVDLGFHQYLRIINMEPKIISTMGMGS